MKSEMIRLIIIVKNVNTCSPDVNPMPTKIFTFLVFHLYAYSFNETFRSKRENEVFNILDLLPI